MKSRLHHIKKVKHIRWLVPGWVFYEYYKIHKNIGHSQRKSIGYGMKAEVVRLATMASLPLPGTYELTTTGLAFLKKKIESGEIEHFSLMAFKDFAPINRLRVNLNELTDARVLKFVRQKRKIYFKIFYRSKKPYLKLLYKKK